MLITKLMLGQDFEGNKFNSFMQFNVVLQLLLAFPENVSHMNFLKIISKNID